jgi:uncharacterized protein YkwD
MNHPAGMKMRIPFFALLILALLILAPFLRPRTDVLARPLPQEETPAAADLIVAVNALRVSNGLAALSAHPVLMQVAQWQAQTLAGSEGASGHSRPPDMTLGQQLLALGYPLSGDLTLDGYRSENIVWGPGMGVQDAVTAWGGDFEHTNTMLSPNRSDIGAAVASAQDEWGFIVHYYVLETALQTSSGRMQLDAHPILTAIAANQAAYSAGATQSAADGLLPQYVIPVVRSTALPNGDVFHKVQYGQTLWSIAVTYSGRIDQIRTWNGLGDTTAIYVGQNLLVQKAATPPPQASATSPQAPASAATATPTLPTPGPTSTVQPSSTSATRDRPSPPPFGLWVGLVLAVVVVGALIGAWLIRSPQ